MRERLINLISRADEECKHSKSCENCSGYGKGSLCMDYHLADHLIANGVVLLPCKVGDVCYPLDASEKNLTCEETISRITISERNIIIGYYEHWDYDKKCRKTDTWRLPLRTRILGKGVFITREEAKAKLKEGAE